MTNFFNRYRVRCPEKNCDFSSNAIESHLRKFHHYSQDDSKEIVSEMIKSFNHITLLVKHGSFKPVKCHICHYFVKRIDIHGKTKHKLSSGDLEDYMDQCRKATPNSMFYVSFQF